MTNPRSVWQPFSIVLGLAVSGGCGDTPNDLNDQTELDSRRARCGDGRCDAARGESCSSCARDCGPCQIPEGGAESDAGPDSSTTPDAGSGGGTGADAGKQSPPVGTSMSALAASMAHGSWAELVASNIGTALSSTDVGGGATGYITIYTDDAVWNPSTRELFFVGSDHNPEAWSTKFVSYSDNTNSWSELPRPPWAHYGTMHGYDHSAVDQAKGVLYHRPFANLEVHRYDTATQAWDQPPLTPFPFTWDYNNCCDALEYFPELGGLVWASGNGTVYLYQDDIAQWSKLATGLDLGGTWHMAEYNPVHKLLVFYSADTGALYQLSSAGQITRLKDPPVALYTGNGYNGVFTTDPVSGTFLLLTPGARDLYSYDPVSDVWQAESSTNKPDLTNEGVIASPVNTYGVTAFTACAGSDDCHMYLYKR
jgi:hypothetical protein